MNNVSEQKKDSILKTLAIAGFIGIIILIAWLSVKLVGIAPETFSSLASLAEGLNQQESALHEDKKLPTFIVTSDSKLLNAGGSATLNWGTASIPGSFTFSHECTDGVAVDLIDVDGLKSISCDTNYNIGDVTSLRISVDSEKTRYADVPYTIAFLGTNDTKPRAEGTGSITIINSEISSLAIEDEGSTAEEMVDDFVNAIASTFGNDKSEEVVAEETATEEVEETTELVEETVVEETPSTPTTPTTPVYEQEFVYTLPTSDPDGRTDLGIRFVSTGKIVGNTYFVEAVEQNESGAIQFAVKNYGTKTSEEWTYTVSLPGGGEYESDTQKALLPNEEATLTIGFPEAVGTSHTFKVKISEETDRNSLNDRFSQKVNFVK